MLPKSKNRPTNRSWCGCQLIVQSFEHGNRGKGELFNAVRRINQSGRKMDLNVEPLEIVSEQVSGFLTKAVALAPNLLAATIVLLVTWVLAALFGRSLSSLLRRSQSRPSLTVALSKLVSTVVWLSGALIALTLIFPNLTPTKLLTGLGLGSIAVGLAFKDIFENFLAGFLILLRKPMRIGDDIECNDLSGKVEEITIRDTFLRKRSGELVLVPNSYLYKNPVKVLTDHPYRRISIIVGVAYGEDVDAARKVIKDATTAVNERQDAKPVEVFACKFNASSIDFLVRWWAGSTPREEHLSRDLMVASIKHALDKAGIEIPFPHRTLTFAEPLEVERVSDNKKT